MDEVYIMVDNSLLQNAYDFKNPVALLVVAIVWYRCRNLTSKKCSRWIGDYSSGQWRRFLYDGRNTVGHQDRDCFDYVIPAKPHMRILFAVLCKKI